MRWSRDWKVWALLGGGLLLGSVELVGLLNDAAGDTASERVWALPWPFRLLLGGFCAWLAGHFAFKWWRGWKHRRRVKSDA